MKNKIKAFFSSKRNLSIFFALLSFVLILLLDLLTKGLIVKNVVPNVGDYKLIIPHLISFVYVQNRGAAWGIFQNNNIFLIITSFIGIGLVVCFYVFRMLKTRGKSSILLGVTAGFITAGALGNLIDRLAFGYVRDFINFEFINFPVFNFADVALTFGVIMLVIYMLFIYTKESEKQPVKNDNLSKINEKQVKIDEKEPKNEENTSKIENNDQVEEKDDERKV